MNANDFHVGQLVSAADTDTMIALCATYTHHTHHTTHGLIVAPDEHRVAVRCCAPARSPRAPGDPHSPGAALQPCRQRPSRLPSHQMPSPASRSAN
jgi:hypothetical protein